MSLMGNKAIFRLDIDEYPNTKTGKNLTGGELENGAFVEIDVLTGSLVDKDTHNLNKLSGEDNKVVGFVSDPCLMYDESKTERDFICPVGALIRTYIPNETTVSTHALKHFDAKGAGIEVGDLLCVNPASTQLKKVAEGEKAVAQVIAREFFEEQESLVLRFIK